MSDASVEVSIVVVEPLVVIEQALVIAESGNQAEVMAVIDAVSAFVVAIDRYRGHLSTLGKLDGARRSLDPGPSRVAPCDVEVDLWRLKRTAEYLGATWLPKAPPDTPESAEPNGRPAEGEDDDIPF